MTGWRVGPQFRLVPLGGAMSRPAACGGVQSAGARAGVVMKLDTLVVVVLIVAALVVAGGPADALRSRRRHRQGLTRHRRFGSVEFRLVTPILSSA